MSDKSITMSTDMENYKGRDVMFYLQEKNLDPMLVRIISSLAERNYNLNKQLAELALIIKAVVELQSNFMNISENLKGKVESVQKSLSAENLKGSEHEFDN